MEVLISVLMSIYNEKFEWIQEAVESILRQTYKKIQFIIVVDNPSLDMEIKTYLEQLQKEDERVYVIYNEYNLGLAKSLNIGLSHANGEIIARMDADDISELNRLEIELEQMEKKGVDLIGTGKVLIDEEGKIIASYEPPITDGKIIKRILPMTSCFAHPTVMIKTNILKQVDGYRNFRRSQDYDLWLRLLKHGCQFANVEQPLLKYRVRSSSITKKKPYAQYLTSTYQKQLFRKSIRNGENKFSENEFENYLKKHDGLSVKKNIDYELALNQLNHGIRMLKKRDIRGLLFIIKAIVCFPEIIGVLFEKVKIICCIRLFR